MKYSLILRQSLCCLFLMVASSANCVAQDEITPYLDSSTNVVGWVDISKVDVEEAVEWSAEITGGPGQNEIASLESLKDALLQLGVNKIYYVSDFSGMMNGPDRFIIPCEKPETVELLLSGFTGNSGPDMASRGNVVVIGSEKGVMSILSSDGQPSEFLSQALKGHGDTPHGLVFATSPETARVLMQVLSQSLKDDVGEILNLARIIPEMKAVAVETSSLPPEEVKAFIQTDNNNEVAKALVALMDSRLPGVSKHLQISQAPGHVAVSTKSLKKLTQVLHKASGGERMSRMNDLKYVALALHNFYATYEHFPPQALTDKQGKRLLSWRVMILPFLEQNALYQQFHLDEPWDSPHNLEVAKTIPMQYAVKEGPGTNADGFPLTTILAPMTKDSAFGRPGKPLQFKSVLDGTSNTLWFLDAPASKAVPWTKPVDLTYDPKNPHDSLFGPDRQEFIGAIMDGSVHVLPKAAKADVLNSLITVDGGEVINQEDLNPEGR
ncbi:MAG: DUF1559 domain-containing protein [Planctomycetota bacterium]